MNIYDVSKRAGVSIATVSRVLNQGPGVSAKTRDKVLSVIAESGYQPNAFARGLGLNSMRTIGLLCADVADPFLAQAISHLERMLRDKGYGCLLCCTGYARENREKCLALLIEKRVDGVVFVGSNFVRRQPEENQYILDAAKLLPVMIVNGALNGDNIYCTLCDDEQASFDATARMIQAGRRAPVYLYHIETYASERKLKGFRRALEESGLAAREEAMRLITGEPLEAARELLTQLDASGYAFDAVLTSDDALAVGALKYAAQKGRRVPDDLAIIGYNNSALSRCSEPELSSIDNQLESLCAHTVVTLMGVLQGQNMPKTTIFNAQIIERRSTP